MGGSAPSVSTSTQPTTNATQGGIQSLLANLLTTGTPPAGIQAYTGSFAAPLTSGETGIVNSAVGATPSGVTPAQVTGGADLASILPALLNYKAPQVSAPTTSGAAPITGGAPVTAQQIDPSAAFQTGVVAPTTANFLQTVVPAITGGAGRSAGGAYSSDTAKAEGLAASNLNTTLAGEGAQYALGAQEANQNANLTANLANLTAANNIAMANQGTQEQTSLADLSSILGTNNLNVNSALTGQSDVLAGVGEAPTAISGPDLGPASLASTLGPLLNIAQLPQQTQQVQTTGQYQDFLNQIAQGQTLAQLMAAFSTTPTQQTTSVVNPGQPSILGGLLGGIGSTAGAAAGKALFNLV